MVVREVVVGSEEEAVGGTQASRVDMFFISLSLFSGIAFGSFSARLRSGNKIRSRRL